MFGIAVLAALIKLWNPDVSGSKPLAAEPRPDAPQASSPIVEPGVGAQKLLPQEATTSEREASFVRHELHIPDEKETPARGLRSAEPTSEPPVFYRRAPGASLEGKSGDRAAQSGPVCGDLGDFPRSSRIIFPLQDDYLHSYEDTWGAARPQGGHEGTDLMTPSGVPEYAITDGTMVPVSGSNKKGWNSLGGYAVMIRADHDIGPVREGDLFYYAHMDEKSALPIGAKVRAGQVVGYSGDTGQGPEGTRGLFPPHLHLGWYDGGGERSDLDSGAMNPYPLLEWLKRNGGSVTGGSGAEYCESPRPEDVPSAGTEGWAPPASPGRRPDLDTGTEDPRPSPVVKAAVKERLSAAPKRGAREGEKKERATNGPPEHRKNVRAASRRVEDATKNSQPGSLQPQSLSKSRRPADSPDSSERPRASRERPVQAGSREDARPPGSTERTEKSGAEAPPDRADSGSSPKKHQRERPAKPRLGEEGGCETAGCSVESDDTQIPEEPPEKTNPSVASGTAVTGDEEKEGYSQETVEQLSAETGAVP